MNDTETSNKCPTDWNIEGTDVARLNKIFSGDARRFRDLLLKEIEVTTQGPVESTHV